MADDIDEIEDMLEAPYKNPIVKQVNLKKK